KWKTVHPFSSFRYLRSYDGLGRLALVATLFFLAHESLPGVFVLYSGFRYGWQETMVGLVLGAVGISQTIISVAVVGPAVRKLGERRALLAGIAFAIVGFTIYGSATTGFFFMFGVPVLAMWGLISPSLQSLASQTVPPTEQGQLQGAFGSIRGIMGM